MKMNKICQYADVYYYNHPQVYQPADDTFLLAENLQVETRSRVLEIGTGTGILAIMASRKASLVIATDVNPFALQIATKNIITNKAFNIELREGSLFEPVKKEKFDLIIFNPPYLPTSEDEKAYDHLEKAWDGGVTGRDVLDPFLGEVVDHLHPEGKVQLLQSNLTNIDLTIKKMREIGLDPIITAERKCFFEELVVITATYNP